MRAFTLVVGVLVAGCGGARSAAPPPANEHMVMRQAWTIERALATFPSDVDVVLAIDGAKLWRAPLVADHRDVLLDLVGSAGGGSAGFQACPELFMEASMVASIAMRSAADIGMRGLYLGRGRALFECALESAAGHSDTARVDERTVDTAAIFADGVLLNYFVVDDDTLLFATGSGMTREALVAATQPAPHRVSSPELAWAAGSGGAVWFVFVPQSPTIAALREKLLGGAGAVTVGHRVELRGRVRSPDDAVAAELATSTEQVFKQLSDFGFVDTASVELDDAAGFAVEVVVERATIERLAAQFGPMIRQRMQERRQQRPQPLLQP
jgi:hypothetical protein